MKSALKTFKALSDPNRLRIFMMLREKQLCVCKIVDILGLATSTVSKHLSILREADLISDQKDGRWVNYELSSQDHSHLFALLDEQLAKDATISSDLDLIADVDRFQICTPEELAST